LGATFVGGVAEGGTVHLAASGISAEVDGATTLMQAGEQAGILTPFGCRIGICHTLRGPDRRRARDLRNGTDYGGGHQKVQTCITVAAGDCVLDV